MYLSHYKLKKKPFDISPDPDFLWLGEKHREGLATLKYGISQNKGFLMITGDIGTGKTALIRAIEKAVRPGIIVVTIPDPSLSLLDFYNVMASELNMGRAFESKGEFLIEFKRFMLQAAGSHKRVLMIIDESHRLSSQLLEEIRLLSNIDFGGHVLINIFFIGQLEFNTLVTKSENRAVRQRIAVSYELLPLTLEETQQYIVHRLNIAGASQSIFTPEAVRLVHGFARGYPRLINIICDHALMSGFSNGVDRISPEVIKECGHELEITIGSMRRDDVKMPTIAPQKTILPAHNFPTSAADPSDRFRWRRAAIFAAFAATFAFTWYFGGDRISDILSRGGKTKEAHAEADKNKSDRVATPESENNIESTAPGPPEAPAALAGALGVQKDIVGVKSSLAVHRVSVPGTAPQSPLSSSARPWPPWPDATQSPGATPQAEVDDSVVAGFPIPLERPELIIFFAKNSTEIPIYAQDILVTAAKLLRTYLETQAVIEGHTDATGDPSVNRDVSEERAASVKNYLVGQGIEANRLVVLCYGSEMPLESNSTSLGRSKNRRAVIRIEPVSRGETKFKS